MIYQIHEQTPHGRQVTKTVELLQRGGVIVYPTDTLYSYGCDISQKSAIEQVMRITKRDTKKPLSIILSDLADVHRYVRHLSNEAFKIMKRALPGPYTFIFQASKEIPKMLLTKQKTIGIRVPDSLFIRQVVAELGSPVISTSVDTNEGDYIIEPGELEKECRSCVDLVLDSGTKVPNPSTVVDFSNGSPVVLREGKGEIFF